MSNFRFSHQAFDQDQQKKSARIKALAELIEDELDTWEPSRELSLALTNLEQAVMWSNKALRDVSRGQ